MSLLAAWVLYPLVLAALCAGLGLLVDRVAGCRLPGPLVLPAGFAAAVVVGGLTTATDATAELTVPLLVTLAAAGAGLSLPWRYGRPDPWPAAVAIGVFLVFGAPVLFSGEPGFAGYIKLDDTATWLALTDRIMEHGRSLTGLEPSSYRSTLEFNLAGGYPVGAFVPFGSAQRLVGGDLAWVFQPYLSFLAAILSLSLWQLFGGLLREPPRRAALAFLAAQPALLYGYALWGGIKELAAAALLALVAALAPSVLRRDGGVVAAIPLAIAAAALVGVLSPAGAVWIAPLLAALAILAHRRLGARRAVVLALVFAAVLVALIVPALAAGIIPPTSKSLVGSDGEGNLRGPLNVLQALGIWPNGDFRFDPGATFPSVLLIGLGLVAAALGLGTAWRRRALAPLLAASFVLPAAAIVVLGSPWAAGKALATVSPVLLSFAVAGALLALSLDRIGGALLTAAVCFGVLWSNALAYHDVSLAPYAQLRELERIGKRYAGDGPALLTEYQPYGARHFLRDLDAEGASELRFRQVTLVDGTTLEKGAWADTDRISLEALLVYRTLVLRHGPAQSRPPSVYSLVQSGEYYDVWQRPSRPTPIASHLPLGNFDDPGAIPACRTVQGLAAVAGPGGTLAAVERGPNAISPLLRGVRIAIPGRYEVYLLGSARNRLTAEVDGKDAGSVVMQLNPSRQFLRFGDIALQEGRHRVRLFEQERSLLAPGSGGPPLPLGPLVFSPAGTLRAPVLRVPAERAMELCGRRLDWIEAIPAS